MRHPDSVVAAAIRIALFLLLSTLPAAPGRAITVGEIPTPRPASWAVDTTGRIPRETLRQFDLIGDQVQATNGGELAVAVVDTTGGFPSRSFATSLFNTWRIGQRGRDNGVLLFAALDDHKVEIVLGHGLANPLLQRASEEIVEGVLVPRFRQGDPASALLAGTRACARRLLDVPLVGATAGDSTGGDVWATPPANGFSTSAILLLVLGGLGGIVWGVYKLATRPRRCPQCGAAMASADAAPYLTPVEQTETRLGSVRLDVFRCPSCGTIDKRLRSNPISHYYNCPECSALALEERRRTLRQPTLTEEGLTEIVVLCRHCSYTATTTGSLPRLGQPSTYYDASTLGSSSSSSSDSFSSSSSSAGSDSGFGGGSSGGDGASGSW